MVSVADRWCALVTAALRRRKEAEPSYIGQRSAQLIIFSEWVICVYVKLFETGSLSFLVISSPTGNSFIFSMPDLFLVFKWILTQVKYCSHILRPCHYHLWLTSFTGPFVIIVLKVFFLLFIFVCFAHTELQVIVLGRKHHYSQDYILTVLFGFLMPFLVLTVFLFLSICFVLKIVCY